MPSTLKPTSSDHYHFVTGKLAEPMLREVIEGLASRLGFKFSINVMPITVAALMNATWLIKRLQVPAEATHVIVPGYLEAGCDELASALSVPVIIGPKDCRLLPELFGASVSAQELTEYSISIIGEINHVPRLPIESVVRTANLFRADGANMIDVGCDPAGRCEGIGDYVAALIEQGHVVSIDSFDDWEVEQATQAGASLVLSVNSTNRHLATKWGAEVVAIPDHPSDEASLWETAAFLSKHNVPFRLDPILEPIGTGFAKSLVRYASTRERFPDAAMMMGIGNLTELTDVDSAGVNMLLIAICEELRIESVLTTQVINWARSSVKECDAARRISHYAITHQTPPKRLSSDLVMLRDPKLLHYSQETLDKLAESLKDNNYRLFADANELHLLSRLMHLSDRDPFALFEKLLEQPISENVDATHAFYLGFEMAKASIARSLGKQYTQDESLRWGLLSDIEQHHRLKRASKKDRQS
jgi:dihydropteroate synthase-like protein